MGRILECRNRGQVQLFETSTNGEQYVAVQAPTALASTYTLTLPTTAGTNGYYLQTDGSGGLSWNTVAASLQIAYNGGQSISSMTNPIAITQTSANKAMTIGQSGADSALVISQSGAAEAILIDQLTNNYALRINKTHTGNSVVIWIDNSGTGECIHLDCDGNCPGLVINKTNTGNANAVSITDSGSGHSLFVTNSGGGDAIYITQYSAVQGIYVDQVGNNHGVHVNVTTTTNTAAAVNVDNAGVGPALHLEQVGEAVALQVDKNSTGSANAIQITNSGSGYDILGHGGTWSLSKVGVAVFGSSVSTERVLLNKTNTDANHVISITNAGSGNDIIGNSNNWYVDKSGNATFNSVTEATPGNALPKGNSGHATINVNSSAYTTITDCVLASLPISRKVMVHFSVKCNEEHGIGAGYYAWYKLQRISSAGTTDLIAETLFLNTGGGISQPDGVTPRTFIDTTATTGNHTYRVVARNDFWTSAPHITADVSVIEIQ